jgi:site-specific recombinase XerD
MNGFKDWYLSNNKSKSKSTISTFAQAIKRIEKFIKVKYDEWNKETFKNSNMILDGLIEDYSLNTIIQTIVIIVKFLEYKKYEKQEKEYRDIMNELVNERNSEEIKSTTKKEDEWIDWNEMKDIYLKHSNDYLNNKKSFTKYRNYLIAGLFILNKAPLRIGNYLDVKLKNNCKRDIKSLNKKYNYICEYEEGKYKLVFNNYKTAKYLGKQENKITNSILNALIKKWFEDYNNKKKDWFLINYNGNKITQPNFTQALKSISKELFNLNLSVNDYRHIFITHFLSNNPSPIERKEIAEFMGQKFKMNRQDLYLRQT